MIDHISEEGIEMDRSEVSGVDIEAQADSSVSQDQDLRQSNSLRFHPDKMYSRREVLSRRQLFQKAQTIQKYEEKSNDGDESKKQSEQSIQPEQSRIPRECYVQVVTGLKDAMDPKLRRRKEFGKRTVENANGEAEFGSDTQYRLISLGGHTREQISYDPTKGGMFNQLGFSAYIHWSYKASFVGVFLSLTVVFYAYVTLFAILLFIVGIAQPECLYVGSSDTDFQQAGKHFIDAFAISWTTFSTVGYGVTGPQLSLYNDDRCLLVNMFTAIEAFVGVLFAGGAGAIILGKIMRYNAIAPVTWSDPLVVKYGSGVKIEENDANETREGTQLGDEKKDDDELEDCATGPIPYPILEFRVLNDAFARDGGELANITISAWVRILAKNATQELRDAARTTGVNYRRLRKLQRGRQMEHHRRKKMSNGVNALQMGNKLKHVEGTEVGKRVSIFGMAMGSPRSDSNRNRLSPSSHGDLARSQVSTDNVSNITDVASSATLYPDVLDPMDLMDGLHASIPGHPSAGLLIRESSRGIVMMDDGGCAHSAGLSHPTIYSRLVLENENHPFLKRCWHLRHQIGRNSPLLNCDARKTIQQFHGAGGEGWPPELNSHEELRKHICFEELSVTLSGTDHITGNTVYGTSIYFLDDIVIGYRFANCLNKDPKTGQVGVDVTLINDVLEQHGGGGEPLFNDGQDDQDFRPPLEAVNSTTSSRRAEATSGKSDTAKEE